MARKAVKKKDLKEQVMKMKERGEKLLLTKKRILGLDTGFPLLSLAIDGFQSELYILAGGSAMGKTTFVTQLCWQMLEKNQREDLRLVFLSLDQSSLDITAKFVSQSGDLPIDYVLHPYPVDEELDEKRIRAISRVSGYRERMQVIDEDDFSLPDLEQLLKSMRKEDGEGKIFVIIDPLLKVKSGVDNHSFIENYRYVILNLKKMCRKYDCGMLVTYGLSKNAELGRPEKKDMLEIPELLSLSYVYLSLYCDYMVDFGTPFLEWDWSGRDIMVPVSEMTVVKNKMNLFRGRIFYRYFASLANYIECVNEENDNYEQMIGNIDYHREKKDLKKRQLLEKALLRDDKLDI